MIDWWDAAGELVGWVLSVVAGLQQLMIPLHAS